MTSTETLTERLRRASTAVYLAAEESVAADLSDMLRKAADVLDALVEAIEHSEGELGFEVQRRIDIEATVARLTEELETLKRDINIIGYQ